MELNGVIGQGETRVLYNPCVLESFSKASILLWFLFCLSNFTRAGPHEPLNPSTSEVSALRCGLGVMNWCSASKGLIYTSAAAGSVMQQRTQSSCFEGQAWHTASGGLFSTSLSAPACPVPHLQEQEQEQEQSLLEAATSTSDLQCSLHCHWETWETSRNWAIILLCPTFNSDRLQELPSQTFVSNSKLDLDVQTLPMTLG